MHTTCCIHSLPYLINHVIGKEKWRNCTLHVTRLSNQYVPLYLIDCFVWIEVDTIILNYLEQGLLNSHVLSLASITFCWNLVGLKQRSSVWKSDLTIFFEVQPLTSEYMLPRKEIPLADEKERKWLLHFPFVLHFNFFLPFRFSKWKEN